MTVVEARERFSREAMAAYTQGASFAEFVEKLQETEPGVAALIPERERDAVFHLVWKKRSRR